MACDTDADCPAIYEISPESAYACVHGLCQNVDTTLYPRDALSYDVVESLCFAVRPRTDTADVFSPTTREIESTVSAACPLTAAPADCQLPAGCMMP